jgi:hypothetical protein
LNSIRRVSLPLSKSVNKMVLLYKARLVAGLRAWGR